MKEIPHVPGWWEDEIPRDVRKKAYENAMKALGLDCEIREHYEHEVEHFLDANRYLNWQSENPWSPIRFYAPAVSFLSTFFDPRGAEIVEVGTGITGIAALTYMASRGASVTAVDHIVMPAHAVLERSGVKFKQEKWEYIAGYFAESSLDVIYTHFMPPDPQAYGPFFSAEGHPLTGYNREPAVSIRREDKTRFTEHVAREMLKILKPGGVFFACSNNCEDLPPDFAPQQRSFEALGYREEEYRLPRDGYYRRYLFVAQKPE